ncbi:hypothetical protein [Schumannella luteola]
MRLSRHSILLPATALVAAALLAGCVPTEEDSPTASPTPTPTPTESSTPTPSAAPTAEIIPFQVACDQLLSPDALYSIDPNYGLLGPFTPDAGTPAAAVVAAGGTACRWTHETSGATLDIAVAELPAVTSTSIKNTLVTESNSVPTYGVEGYFRVNGSLGEANAFPDPYWVTVVSAQFSEPGDASPVVNAVIGSL